MAEKIFGDEFDALKDKIAKVMKSLCDHNLTTTLGGNISNRISSGMLITPSGLDKHSLVSSDIVEIDFDGNVRKGQHDPSMEYRIHTGIYNVRRDVGAIIHSHCFFSTLFSILETEINVKLTAESAKNVGNIAVAPYATMGSSELAENVVNLIADHNAVLMKNHGVVVVGKDLLDAFYKLEVVEQTAKLTYFALNHSDKACGISEISEDDVKKYLKQQ